MSGREFYSEYITIDFTISSFCCERVHGFNEVFQLCCIDLGVNARDFLSLKVRASGETTCMVIIFTSMA